MSNDCGVFTVKNALREMEVPEWKDVTRAWMKKLWEEQQPSEEEHENEPRPAKRGRSSAASQSSQQRSANKKSRKETVSAASEESFHVSATIPPASQPKRRRGYSVSSVSLSQNSRARTVSVTQTYVTSGSVTMTGGSQGGITTKKKRQSEAEMLRAMTRRI